MSLPAPLLAVVRDPAARSDRLVRARRFARWWGRRPRVAALLEKLEAIDADGRDAAEVILATARPMLERIGWITQGLAAMARELARDPLFEPPFRAVHDEAQDGLLLIDHPLLRITALALSADATSISLNIAQGSAGRAFLDQYRYDLDRDLIAGQLAYSPSEALIALLPGLGGEEGLDLLDHLARRHPSDRVRSGAIAAALRRGGLAIVDAADDAFDLIVTVGGTASVISIGMIEIDVARRETRLAGRNLRLTRIEQALLVALARAHHPIGRVALLESIWGYRFDPGTNLVAVHIHRLRAKIGQARIACGPDGYRLTDGEG